MDNLRICDVKPVNFFKKIYSFSIPHSNHFWMFPQAFLNTFWQLTDAFWTQLKQLKKIWFPGHPKKISLPNLAKGQMLSKFHFETAKWCTMTSSNTTMILFSFKFSKCWPKTNFWALHHTFALNLQFCTFGVPRVLGQRRVLRTTLKGSKGDSKQLRVPPDMRAAPAWTIWEFMTSNRWISSKNWSFRIPDSNHFWMFPWSPKHS